MITVDRMQEERQLNREIKDMTILLNVMRGGFTWSKTHAGLDFWSNVEDELEKEIAMRENMLNNSNE
jgi:hypothetical protein